MQLRRMLGIDPKTMERRRDSGVAQGVDLAATFAIFVFLGMFLDSQFGTAPWISVGMAAFAGVGTMTTAFYRYETRMRSLSEGKPWTRRPIGTRASAVTSRRVRPAKDAA